MDERNYHELLFALQEVADLDGLQALASANEIADRTSAELSEWLRLLCNCERARRDGGPADYALADVFDWLPPAIVPAMLFSCFLLQVATQVGEPTAERFCWELHKLMCAIVGSHLLSVQYEQGGVA